MSFLQVVLGQACAADANADIGLGGRVYVFVILMTEQAARLGGFAAGLSWPYFAATVIIGLLLIWERQVVEKKELEEIDLAFFTINSYVSVTLLAGVIAASIIS